MTPHPPKTTAVTKGPAHLVLVLNLDEEGESKAHLGQLGDGHAVLGAVELGRIVVDVDDQDVEGGGDGGVGGRAVVVQLCALQGEKPTGQSGSFFMGQVTEQDEMASGCAKEV